MYTYEFVYAFMYTHIHKYICTYTYMCMGVYIYTHVINSCTYIIIHVLICMFLTLCFLVYVPGKPRALLVNGSLEIPCKVVRVYSQNLRGRKTLGLVSVCTSGKQICLLL